MLFFGVLILVLVRRRILVVVPEMSVLRQINSCNQIVIRITLLVKPEIHIYFLARFGANCHNVPVAARFLMTVVICHLTSIKCNYMILKCFIDTCCNSRIDKWIYLLCCHNTLFFLLLLLFVFTSLLAPLRLRLVLCRRYTD